MHCLLNDLLHFCDHSGLDFTRILDWARSSHADDLVMEQAFSYGDEGFRPKAARERSCGGTVFERLEGHGNTHIALSDEHGLRAG